MSSEETTPDIPSGPETHELPKASPTEPASSPVVLREEAAPSVNLNAAPLSLSPDSHSQLPDSGNAQEVIDRYIDGLAAPPEGQSSGEAEPADAGYSPDDDVILSSLPGRVPLSAIHRMMEVPKSWTIHLQRPDAPAEKGARTPAPAEATSALDVSDIKRASLLVDALKEILIAQRAKEDNPVRWEAGEQLVYGRSVKTLRLTLPLHTMIQGHNSYHANKAERDFPISSLAAARCIVDIVQSATNDLRLVAQNSSHVPNYPDIAVRNSQYCITLCEAENANGAAFELLETALRENVKTLSPDRPR
jgi:hypothetical protein